MTKSYLIACVASKIPFIVDYQHQASTNQHQVFITLNQKEIFAYCLTRTKPTDKILIYQINQITLKLIKLMKSYSNKSQNLL